MIISYKDSWKFLGISIVCFCAVFVCTFFLNYYLDILPLKDMVSSELMPLYNAQLATAKMTCGITGGFLSLIALIMLFFYIKLYIDNHHKILGTFKALGYTNSEIAKHFTSFSISILIGCGLGFSFGWLCMPFIYKNLTIAGLPVVSATFHPQLLVCLVFIPTFVSVFLAFLYAFFVLKKPVLELIKGKRKKTSKSYLQKKRPFLKEMRCSIIKSQKMLAFFVSFSTFCFSAMVQMGLSMEDLVSGTMGIMILLIGLVLAYVSIFMAMTSLVKNNLKSLSIFKVLGFSQKECFLTIFLGFIPLAILGFLIGSIYQFALLSFMINFIFKDVGNVPVYHFNIPVFFLTFFLFLLSYSLIFYKYLRQTKQISIKEIMLDI